MNNELYRKLTSITLMTIMFAGGMTIAIPGELPTAVAQTNTLSVSASAAGVFGGAQVIEIIVDDPDRADAGDTTPDVEINEEMVTMTQSATGKWYAYVADTSAYTDADLPTDGAFPTKLPGLPDPETNTWGAGTVQTEEFEDGDEVEITAGRNESVTLTYDDHSDIATISVDRNDVPAGGQVHITIGDFQLNLDPTADDSWNLTARGAVYTTTAYANGTSYAVTLPGTSGALTIGGSDTNVIEYSDDDMVAIDETGSNTGVFESQSDDISEISVNMATAVSGDTFTIAYADDDQQVIVDSFDSTLELVADGTWNSGDTLTVRLTNENLNINTLKDDDMGITDSVLPTMTFGTPLTITDFDLTPVNPGDSLAYSGHDSGTVTLTASLAATVFDVVLSGAQLEMFQNTAMYHYVNYYPDPDSDLVTSIMTDAQLIDKNGDPASSTTITKGLTRVQAQIGDESNDVDGKFAITFNTNIGETTNNDNANIHAALNAINSDDNAETIATSIETRGTEIETASENEDLGERARLIETALNGFRTDIAGLTGVTGDAATNVTGVPVTKDGEAVDTDETEDDPATTPGEFETPTTLLAKIKVDLDNAIAKSETTFALEVFTFGIVNGETLNNAIYRPLLEETSSDSGVFEGTIEYKMLNQLTVDDAATYDDVKAVDDELVIILDDGYTGTSAPEVAYDGDHVREDAPSYTGEVSFDSDTYRVADEVTVIVVDPDLNVDADAIDIYTVQANSTEAADTLLHLEIADGCTIDDFENFSLRRDHAQQQHVRGII